MPRRRLQALLLCDAALVAGLVVVYVAVFAALFLNDRPVPSGPVLMLSLWLGATLIALSVIDIRSGILPDILTLPLAGSGVIVTMWIGSSSVINSIIGGVIGFCLIFFVNIIYKTVKKRDGIGMGDGKLLSAAGTWLGVFGIAPVLLWACAMGVTTFVWLWWRHRQIHRQSPIAFGPQLALAFWIVWLHGPV